MSFTAALTKCNRIRNLGAYGCFDIIANPVRGHISFHYIYPALSIGLGVMLVIFEALWLKTKNPLYHQMARFWTRVFALTFAIGVATGIVMEFEFGTNWATYSRYVSAWYLLKKKHLDFARASLRGGRAVGLAAFEGRYDTRTHAPLAMVGWVDEKNERFLFNVEIPGMLSWLAYDG